MDTEFRPLHVWGGIPGEPGRVPSTTVVKTSTVAAGLVQTIHLPLGESRHVTSLIGVAAR